jgi:desulfoferrodoxin (superoxide reductase-like protein)
MTHTGNQRRAMIARADSNERKHVPVVPRRRQTRGQGPAV